MLEVASAVLAGQRADHLHGHLHRIPTSRQHAACSRPAAAPAWHRHRRAAAHRLAASGGATGPTDDGTASSSPGGGRRRVRRQRVRRRYSACNGSGGSRGGSPGAARAPFVQLGRARPAQFAVRPAGRFAI